MLRIACLVLAAVVWTDVPGPRAFAAGGRPQANAAMPYEVTQVHLGMPVRIVLYAADRESAEAAVRAAFARIAALDRIMSDYRPDSELRGLARHGTNPVVVSRDLFAVLHRAVEVGRVTGGAFDPTVGPLVTLWREARRTGRRPGADDLARARAAIGWNRLELDARHSTIRLTATGMHLDLGGIAKGYILQEALVTLRTLGLTRALVEAGGDIVVGSPPPGRGGWRIEAAGADAAFRRQAENLADAALATSGSSEQFVEIDGVRYSHVVDPRTGLGVAHRIVARVIARDAATADAVATALTVTGAAGIPAVTARYPDMAVSLVEDRADRN